jgi:hypothetical protein
MVPEATEILIHPSADLLPLEHGLLDLITELHEIIRGGQASKGVRVLGVQAIGGLEAREEIIYQPLLGDLHGFRCMREEKSIQVEHDRQKDLLGNLEGLDRGVQDFLIILAIEL